MAKTLIPFTTGYNLKQKYVVINGAIRKGEIKVHRDHLLSLAKSLKEIHRLFQSSELSPSRLSSLSCASSKKGKQHSAPVRLSKRDQNKPETGSRLPEKL
jgi:hypothetical protein